MKPQPNTACICGVTYPPNVSPSVHNNCHMVHWQQDTTDDQGYAVKTEKIQHTPVSSSGVEVDSFIKEWEAQGRSEEQIWAVRNFMTGQGNLMLASIRKQGVSEGISRAIAYADSMETMAGDALQNSEGADKGAYDDANFWQRVVRELFEFRDSLGGKP